MAAKEDTMRTTTARIGLTLAVALTGLGGAGLAQNSATNDFMDLTPPDISAPRSAPEYRTCPDREARPEWAENLEGWEVARSLLLSDIYKARTYEAIVATGDCSCAVKAPPWDAVEAEYLEDYAALDLGAVQGAGSDFGRLARGLYRDVRRICREQGNW